MFKLARRLIAGVILLLILLAVGIGIALWRIDALTRRGIERGSTYALGVPTTLASADVQAFRGRLELDGLAIANPPGFPGPTFLTLGDGATSVALSTLRQNTIVIPELHLADIDVTLIRRPGEGSNYQVILDHLKQLGSAGKPRDPGGAEGKAGDKRLIVNDLLLKSITIHYDPGLGGMVGGGGGGQLAQAAGQLAKVTIPIDEIRLSDVGKTGSGVGGSGVTIGELAGIVVEAVLAAAAEKGGDLLPGDLLGDLRTQLAGLNFDELRGSITTTAGKLGDTLRDIKSPEDLKGALDEGKKEVEKLTEGLKDLIPKKK